jgi:hypothetical protein
MSALGENSVKVVGNRSFTSGSLSSKCLDQDIEKEASNGLEKSLDISDLDKRY